MAENKIKPRKCVFQNEPNSHLTATISFGLDFFLCMSFVSALHSQTFEIRRVS